MKIYILIGYVLLKAAEINSCVCVCVCYTGPISPPEAKTYSTDSVSAIRTHRQRGSQLRAVKGRYYMLQRELWKRTMSMKEREWVICTQIWMQVTTFRIAFSIRFEILETKKNRLHEQGKTKTHPISNNKIFLYLSKVFRFCKVRKNVLQ